MKLNDTWRKSVSGSFPDFGAIFMSNRNTKEECFEKKIFGLPSSLADFVKRVKAGMVLFLFEYEQRELYGVFQATSDGAMNIIPHAYCSSGKRFSAQVQFSTIWKCHPLPERGFRDAIKDNYYATYKFNFGLSKDQVQTLLLLFNSRKIGVQKSHSLFTKSEVRKRHHNSSDEINSLVHSDKLVGENDHSMSESQYRSFSGVLISTSAHNSCSSALPGDLTTTSKRPESSPSSYPYSPEAPVFSYPTVSRTNDSFTSEHEFVTHFTGSSEFHPSKGQSVPYCLKLESSSSSSYGVTTDPGDYIPLSSPEHFEPSVGDYVENNEDYIPLCSPEQSDSPETGYAENNNRESVTLEGNKGMSSEAYIAPQFVTIHPERVPCHGNYESSSVSVPLSIFPCLGKYESSAISVPLSILGDCLLKGSAYSSESGSKDCQKHSDPVNHNDDVHHKGLYSDCPIKRVSVFTRLKLAPKPTMQENKNSNKMVLSVNDIMRSLQHRHNNWKKTMRKAESTVPKNVDNTLNKRTSVFSRMTLASNAVFPEKEVNTVTDVSVNKNMENHQLSRSLVKMTMQESLLDVRNHDYGENPNMGIRIKMVNDAFPADLLDPEDEWSSERKVEQTPFLNFKRRKVILKTQYETRERSLQDGSGGDKPQKRRKLVRSMFTNKSSDVQTVICDSSEQLPSQENAVREENNGSCETLIKSDRIDDGENGLSRKDLIPFATCPINCEGNSGETGKSFTSEELKMGELAGARSCCLTNAVTTPLKTYQRHQVALPRSKDPEKNVTVNEDKAESHEASVRTYGDEGHDELLTQNLASKLIPVQILMK